MKRLLIYLKTHKKTLILALALAAINQGFSLVGPQIFRLIIDRYALRIAELSRSEFIQGIGVLLLISMLSAFISRIAKAFQDYYVNLTTETVGTSLYADSVSHVFSLPYAVFEDERSGSVLLKLQKARDDSKRLIESGVNTVFLAAVGMVIVLAYAFYVHPLAGSVYFLMIPVVASVSYHYSKKVKPAQQAIVKASADLSGSTTETLRNVALVKSLGLEEQEVGRLNAVNTAILKLELKKVVLLRKLSFLQGTLVNAVNTLIQFMLFYLLFTGSITIGEVLALFFYGFAVFQPLYELANVVSRYQEANASLDELDLIYKLAPEQSDQKGEAIESIEKVSFKDVSFMYPGSNRDSLARVSFELKPGETIALAGPSGSGKSTVLKLLLGLYAPQQGEVEVNGKSVDTLDYTSLRKDVGYVPQETTLFAGTLRDNLKFVREGASDEDMIDALKHAELHDILDRGNETVGTGLDILIGESGIKLSGGERQRLSIARALLRNPSLIIFDEATSSLDTISEKNITKTISEIRKRRPNLMMILIAHRLSTIEEADRIYVMKQGKIAEEGSHAELIQKKGVYYALWQGQELEERDTLTV